MTPQPPREKRNNNARVVENFCPRKKSQSHLRELFPRKAAAAHYFTLIQVGFSSTAEENCVTFAHVGLAHTIQFVSQWVWEEVRGVLLNVSWFLLSRLPRFLCILQCHGRKSLEKSIFIRRNLMKLASLSKSLDANETGSSRRAWYLVEIQIPLNI